VLENGGRVIILYGTGCGGYYVTQERRLGCLRTEGGLLYYMEQGAGDIILYGTGCGGYYIS